MTPIVPDPDTTDAAHQAAQRVASRWPEIVEFWGKAVGLLTALLTFLWTFFAKVWAPYKERRMQLRAAELRASLKPELDQLTDLLHEEQQCTEQMQAIWRENDDMFRAIREMREGYEETHELLSDLGLHANDRRGGDERRARITDMLDTLDDRRRQRRRRGDRPEKPDRE